MDASEILRLVMNEGFDEAVVTTSSYNSKYLKIANYKLDSIVEKKNERGSIFVTKDKRIAFTSIEKLDIESVRQSINNAKKAISAATPKEDYYGIAEGPFKYKNTVIFDRRIDEMDIDSAAELANDVISKVTVENLAGTLHLSSYKCSIATSKGVEASSNGTEARLSLRIFDKGLSIQDTVSSRKLSEIKVERILSNAELLKYVNTTHRIDGGLYDLLYLRSPAGLLLSNVNSMACIGNVETGSFLTGKLGKRVANSGLSMYDDGSIETGINSLPFDAEGYPTQRTQIIKAGVLIRYLHNYSTAKKYNTRSTGNAGLVYPSPNTLVVEHKKKQSLDKLIASIDKGILITNTWYTRFSNYLTGDFSTMPRDLAIYIKKGSPEFAVKQISLSSGVGIRISDNMIRMMMNITRAGNDIVQATSWDTLGTYYFVPSIIVEDVNVSTA